MENSFFAYTLSLTKGEVSVYDAKEMHPAITINCHISPILLMNFNYFGTLLVTSSCQVYNYKGSND